MAVATFSFTESIKKNWLLYLFLVVALFFFLKNLFQIIFALLLVWVILYLVGEIKEKS